VGGNELIVAPSAYFQRHVIIIMSGSERVATSSLLDTASNNLSEHRLLLNLELEYMCRPDIVYDTQSFITPTLSP
jgi:hypothetical protein